MTVSVPNNATTAVLADVTTGLKSHAVWFQNFSTTVGIYLNSIGAAAATEFYLPPGTSATAPGTLIIQSSGGDATLVNKSWNAFQASGGAVDIKCGRW